MRIPHTLVPGHRPTMAIAACSALAASALSLFALTGCATSAATPSAEARTTGSRPTEAFRQHHAEIREHLHHIDSMAQSLPRQSPDTQRQTMRTVVTFLQEHIGPHAADEERVLYPVVARQAGKEGRLTEVPVYEHRIVERSIADLAREASGPAPDADAFARDAMHLVGLLQAHFEVEEEVLLPVLDRTMTPEEFKREVADKMPH